ncbi:MAG TPA: type IV pilus secretin PilQ [Thermoanaerobaculia bacterium]|nr:type IV pilus secretin PilQ [Thermoanaerobaculia bacterium]
MRTLGSVPRRFKTPIAIGALALCFGCTSSKPARVVEATPASQGRAAAPAAADVPSAASASEIRSMELREGAPGAYLELQASAPLVWTSFRNADGQVVVELPNSRPGADLADLAPGSGLVSSVRIERDSQGSRPLTRFVLQTRQEVEHSVTASGNGLELKLLPVESQAVAAAAPSSSGDGSAGSAYEPVPEEPETAPPAVTASASPPSAAEPVAGADLGTPDAPRVAPPPAGPRATRLDEIVVVSGGGDQATIRLSGDGQFPYTSFVLDAPKRFVLDLPGVTNHTKKSSLPVGGPVERVRVAQFRSPPDAVARIVFDLGAEATPRIERLGNALVVSFGGEPAAAASPEPEPESEPVRTASLAPPPAPAPEVEADSSPPPAPAPVPAPRRQPPAAPSDLNLAPAAPISPGAPLGSPAPPAAVIATPSVSASPSRVVAPRKPGELQEAAPAAGPVSPTDCIGNGSEDRHYIGDPIDLKVTNAEVTDVLRTFSQISGLNIVVQPGVHGTVTAELENVPWDQALAEVLKINGLGCELEGNVMRIAPTEVLGREAQQRQDLATARSLAVPLRTIMKRLSYASAGQVAAVLGSGKSGILSQRGSVLVDARTNTLIIKELPNYLDTVIAVIENLDTPEPQVMIEARIIETTKTFARSLGIDWGFNALADAAHGNTTGLIFPNNGTGAGNVNLLTGGNNGSLALRLGNVLNTFTLDLTLQAAESQGLINILSAPKVATLNNQRASIQSGTQIPIQTVANNTVTVQFINATLRLDVVPQITAEGTILMQIDISKREPLLGQLVPGATNAPIATKDASTRVIVRDGGTAVIGGIYKITNNDGDARVPGLANIPILGYLFRNKTVSNTNEELLIFITPRIIKL